MILGNCADIMVSEILATKAVEYFAMQLSGGALQKMGADSKDYLQKLVGTIYTKFAGRKEIQEVVHNPEALRLAISKELPNDITFREELETIVAKLSAIEESLSKGGSQQISTGSGANVNAPNNSGNVAGRDQHF